MTKAFFRYERGPKGWVPKLYWDEKPKEMTPSKDDPPFHSPTQEVTEILTNEFGNIFERYHAFEYLCGYIPPPPPVGG